MWIYYEPADQDKQEWWISLDDLGDVEAEMIEHRSGYPWAEFHGKLLQGDIRARRSLLWTLLRRQHHTLRYEDVHFRTGQLRVELDAREQGEIVAEMGKRRLTETEQRAMEMMQEQIESGEARPAPGKALDVIEENNTAG